MKESNNMYKLISLYANSQQTMLVEEDGWIVYAMKTEHGITTVKRHAAKGSPEEGQEPVVAGTIEWSRNGETWFTIGEKSQKAKGFLRLPGQSTSRREFTSPGWKDYVWKIATDHLELRPKDENESFFSKKKDIIASYSMEKGRLLGKSDPATLLLGEEAIEMLDTVIVTWVWMSLMLTSQKSKGMFASMETQWATVGQTGAGQVS